MLKEILDKNTCAACRICCSFVEADAWETPVFTSAKIDYNNPWFKCIGKNSHTLKFFFENDKEIKLCPYLDEKTGCTLKGEEKPVDCKMWPLRVMKKKGELYITLAPICKGVTAEHIPKLKEMLDNGLREEIMKNLVDDMVKEYEEEYIIIEKI